jgi:hypothetical protein
MTTLTVTAGNVRALREHGAITIPAQAGEELTIGQLVYPASDGDWNLADANTTAAAARAQGIVVESYDGETTVKDTAHCTVCVFGPVTALTTITPGANYYVSDTAGGVEDAAGTFDRIVGWGAEIAAQNVLWLHFEQNDPSSA